MKNRRVFERNRASAQHFQLTPNDLAAVESVGRFRLILGEQLRQLHWPQPSQKTHAENRLRLLYDAGWLERVPFMDGLSRPRVVYFLGKVGKAHVSDKWSQPVDHLGPRPSKERAHDLLFLKHHLATVQFVINLTLGLAEIGGSLVEFVDERTLRARRQRDATALPLVPDAFLELSFQDKLLTFCLELDRGTVHLRAWRKKLGDYWRWSQTEAFRYQFKEPVVLIVIAAPEGLAQRRLGTLKRLVETDASKSGDDPSLFAFATLADASATALLSEPVWQVAGQAGKHALLAGQSGREAGSHEPLAAFV